MNYLLDTNICIYIIKKKPLAIFNKFRSFPLGTVGISSITLAELRYGIEKSSQVQKNKVALEQFLLPLEILDFNFAASVEYGKIRSILERNGTPIGPLDTLIAAHAKSEGLTLVTNNEKEFKRVDQLKVENWITATG